MDITMDIPAFDTALDSSLANADAVVVGSTSGALFGTLAGFFAAYGFIMLLVGIMMIVAKWIMFKKAGKPGWASIVPIYNLVVEFKIVKLNPWLVLLLLIPVANVVLLIVYSLRLAKVFGYSTGFGVGLILLNVVFLPILAFGSSTYDETKVEKVE